MARNFHEEYRHEDVPPPSERSTGFVFAGVAVIIGAFFYDNLTVLAAWWALAAALALVSWLRPRLLGPVNRVWFKFSLLLYRIVNPVVMLLMYVVAIVPFGMVMQLLRDPLRAKPRKELPSYWIEKQAEDRQESSMTNQF
jgi:hypothetical protein